MTEVHLYIMGITIALLAVCVIIKVSIDKLFTTSRVDATIPLPVVTQIINGLGMCLSMVFPLVFINPLVFLFLFLGVIMLSLILVVVHAIMQFIISKCKAIAWGLHSKQ